MSLLQKNTTRMINDLNPAPATASAGLQGILKDSTTTKAEIGNVHENSLLGRDRLRPRLASLFRRGATMGHAGDAAGDVAMRAVPALPAFHARARASLLAAARYTYDLTEEVRTAPVRTGAAIADAAMFMAPWPAKVPLAAASYGLYKLSAYNQSRKKGRRIEDLSSPGFLP